VVAVPADIEKGYVWLVMSWSGIKKNLHQFLPVITDLKPTNL
jgi:hypothetical protein